MDSEDYDRQLELAWFAGLFEGEGCITIEKNGSTRLTVSMTDRDIIERVEALFPSRGIKVKPQQQAHWKTQYVWRVSGPQVRDILIGILPWLGERRSARAQELFEHMETMIGAGGRHRIKTHCAEGHEYTPENTYLRPGTTHRHCRTCRNEWARRHQRRKAAAKVRPSTKEFTCPLPSCGQKWTAPWRPGKSRAYCSDEHRKEGQRLASRRCYERRTGTSRG